MAITEYRGLILDRFQIDSIQAVNRGHSVVVSAPTGSGKTLIADYVIDREIQTGRRVIYTAPIKALSNQKFKEFTQAFGKEKIGLMTGDVVINPGAQIVIMTTEIYRNMVLVEDASIRDLSYVIFDEIHYINDIERGYVWEESIIFSAPSTRFLCLSATIPNAQEFSDWIKEIKGHEVETIVHTKRSVPLERSFFDSEIGECNLEELRDVAEAPEYPFRKRKRRRFKAQPPNHVDLVMQLKRDQKLPCIFFNFSRASCQKKADELAKRSPFGKFPDNLTLAREKLSDAPAEVGRLKTTQLLRVCLSKGIGFHHAGLLPVLKEIVEELFAHGKIKVLYTTETFAVGINMPAKTVAFESLRKFDGVSFRMLNSKEYFQMAGRAGRRGIDKIGYAIAMVDRRDFDYAKLRKITTKDVEPIKSQFKLSINTVLNLIERHTPAEIDIILSQSFFSYQAKKRAGKKRVMHARYESIKKRLQRMGYLKGMSLTDKGWFASKVFVDELIFGEMFATPFHEGLSDYQILLFFAAVVYEPRERDHVERLYKDREYADLKKRIEGSKFFKRHKRFASLARMTGITRPLYEGRNFFEMLENVSLSEGDLIRFLSQIIDRMDQVKKAGQDEDMRGRLNSIEDRIRNVLEGITLI